MIGVWENVLGDIRCTTSTGVQYRIRWTNITGPFRLYSRHSAEAQWELLGEHLTEGEAKAAVLDCKDAAALNRK